MDRMSQLYADECEWGFQKKKRQPPGGQTAGATETSPVLLVVVFRISLKALGGGATDQTAGHPSQHEARSLGSRAARLRSPSSTTPDAWAESAAPADVLGVEPCHCDHPRGWPEPGYEHDGRFREGPTPAARLGNASQEG